jgi:hypothetical protein
MAHNEAKGTDGKGRDRLEVVLHFFMIQGHRIRCDMRKGFTQTLISALLAPTSPP